MGQVEDKNAPMADRGRRAIEHYISMCPGEDEDFAITDLLADLMHWSSRRDPEGLDPFDSLLDSARGHFEAEERGED